MSWVWLIFRQFRQWEFVDVWKHSVQCVGNAGEMMGSEVPKCRVYNIYAYHLLCSWDQLDIIYLFIVCVGWFEKYLLQKTGWYWYHTLPCHCFLFLPVVKFQFCPFLPLVPVETKQFVECQTINKKLPIISPSLRHPFVQEVWSQKGWIRWVFFFTRYGFYLSIIKIICKDPSRFT